MDNDLLLKLFHLPSPTRQEAEVREFICSFLRANNIPFKTDKIGNIIGLNHPKAPLLSAHMDTVQSPSDCTMAEYIHINGDFVKGYGIIGADDKVGIFIILSLLKDSSEKFNFVFTVQEECGAIGAREFIYNNDLGSIPYGIVLDRKGSSDIICSLNDYGTKEFEFVLESIGEGFGYKSTHGVFSDCDEFSNVFSCANLSVGYFEQHNKTEYAKLSLIKNSMEFTFNILKNVKEKFEAPEKIFRYSKFDNFYGRSIYPTDIDEFNTCSLCGTLTNNTTEVQTIGMFLCDECFNNLLWEIDSKADEFLKVH